MDNEKLPPHDIDAEEAVIGSLLIDGEATGTVTLDAADFYSETARMIYAACKALSDRGEGVNQITVAQELQHQGKLETIGGAAFLSHLISNCPTPLDLHHYVAIVQRLSLCRRLIATGSQIADIGHEANPDIADTLNRADQLLLDLRKNGAPSSIVTPEDREKILYNRYEKLYTVEGGVAIPTGLTDLDKRMGGGFYNGDFVVIGARPSVGKTTILQQLANNIGKGRNVLFCSCEMPMPSISDRDVAALVGVSTNTIRLGGYEHELYDKIIGPAIHELSKRRVYFYQDRPLTTAKVMQAGVTMQLRHGLDLIVIDYLGLLDDEYGASQYERLGYISRKVKGIALKLDVPIIAAHQLNRAVEQRQDKRPELYDLRDSGRLEEDADLVLFLYRESYYEDEADNVTEVIIAKQRQGEARLIVRVYFDKEHQTYHDLAKIGEK